MKAKWENRIDWGSVNLKQQHIKRERELKIELIDGVIENLDKMANGMEGNLQLLGVAPLLLEEYKNILKLKNMN